VLVLEQKNHELEEELKGFEENLKDKEVAMIRRRIKIAIVIAVLRPLKYKSL
jgi:hypothetical protein